MIKKGNCSIFIRQNNWICFICRPKCSRSQNPVWKWQIRYLVWNLSSTIKKNSCCFLTVFKQFMNFKSNFWIYKLFPISIYTSTGIWHLLVKKWFSSQLCVFHFVYITAILSICSHIYRVFNNKKKVCGT